MIDGDGGNAGNISLQTCKNLILADRSERDYLPVGLIELNGDLLAVGGAGTVEGDNEAGAGTDGVGGDIHLGSSGRDAIPSIASITGNPSGGNVTIQGRSITMGQNEKLTVLGNLTMQTNGGDITIGDLTTQSNLTVDAGELGSIFLLRREAGDVRLATSAGGGIAEDAGLDFVANGSMTFIGTLELAGVGENKPQFAAMDTDTISKPPKDDARFIIRQMSESQDLVGSVLDGIATGQVTRSGNGAGAGTTEALAGATSQDSSLMELLREQNPTRNQIGLHQWQQLAAVLEKLGFTLRELSQDDILQGWATYDDFSGNNMLSDSSGWITANRMNPSDILFMAEKLTRFLEDRQQAFQNDFARQYNAHTSATGLKEDSIDRIVNNIPDNSLLKEDLSQIAIALDLLNQMTSLTALEKNQLSERVLQLAKPKEFDIAQFREIITHF